MGIEIERKFVVGDDWPRRRAAGGADGFQGYLNDLATGSIPARCGPRCVRIEATCRLPQHQVRRGPDRRGIRYEIPVADARALLALCVGGIVDKHRRHYVERARPSVGNRRIPRRQRPAWWSPRIGWTTSTKPSSSPAWLGPEATHAQLLQPCARRAPYSQWQGDERRALDLEARVVLIIGIAGHTLAPHERSGCHDACASVILFARNFASRGQVAELTASLREAAPLRCWSAWTRKGGRVQRSATVTARCRRCRGFDAFVPARSRGRIGVGPRARVADGQRSARDGRGPQLRAGGRPRARQPRDRRPRVPAGVVAAFARTYVEDACTGRHDRDPQAPGGMVRCPRTTLRGGGGRSPARGAARSTWCRSKPASPRVPR